MRPAVCSSTTPSAVTVSPRPPRTSGSMEAATASRFVSLLAVCLLASMALMLGYYGPVELAVGRGCSRLVQASSVFVQGIKVSVDAASQSQGSGGGLVLYGLPAGAPPLAVPTEWPEARRVVVPTNSQRQWTYYLNKGVRLQATYSVKSEDGVPLPLCIIIAQGKESFIRWTEVPSVQNNTLVWCLVQGNGTIEQTVNLSSEYYIAARNVNYHHDMTVQLEFRIRTLLYNTSGADCRCSLGHGHCTYRLPFLGRNVAVLSFGHEERLSSDAQHVKLSYEPRWTVYVVGTVVLALVLLLVYEILDQLFGPCSTGGGGGADRRTPLLPDKEDDGASLGSSYDGSDDREPEPEPERGEGGGGCVLCCDAPKDCFFLPCGHSATCYACGARIVEENGGCPFCRKKLKKEGGSSLYDQTD